MARSLSLRLSLGSSPKSAGRDVAMLVFNSTTGVATATLPGASTWAFFDESGTTLTGSGNTIARANTTAGKGTYAVPDGNMARASNLIFANPAPPAVYDDILFSSFPSTNYLSGYRENNPGFNQAGSGPIAPTYYLLADLTTEAWRYQGYVQLIGSGVVTTGYHDVYGFVSNQMQRSGGNLDPGSSTFYMNASLSGTSGYGFTWKGVNLANFTSSVILPITLLGKYISGNSSTDFQLWVQGTQLTFVRAGYSAGTQTVPITQTGVNDISWTVDPTAMKVRVFVGGVEPETAGTYIKGAGIDINSTGTPLTITGCRPGILQSLAGLIPDGVNLATGYKATALAASYFSIASQTFNAATLTVPAQCVVVVNAPGGTTSADWVILDPTTYAEIGTFQTAAVSSGQFTATFSTVGLQGTTPLIAARDSTTKSIFNVLSLSTIEYAQPVVLSQVAFNSGVGSYYGIQGKQINRAAHDFPVSQPTDSVPIPRGTNGYPMGYGAGQTGFWWWIIFPQVEYQVGVEWTITSNKPCTLANLVGSDFTLGAITPTTLKFTPHSTGSQFVLGITAVSFSGSPSDELIIDARPTADLGITKATIAQHISTYHGNMFGGWIWYRYMKWLEAEEGNGQGTGYWGLPTDTVWIAPAGNLSANPEFCAQDMTDRNCHGYFNFKSGMPLPVITDFANRNKARLDALGNTTALVQATYGNENMWNNALYGRNGADIYSQTYNSGLMTGSVPSPLSTVEVDNVDLDTGVTSKAFTAGQVIIVYVGYSLKLVHVDSNTSIGATIPSSGTSGGFTIMTPGGTPSGGNIIEAQYRWCYLQSARIGEIFKTAFGAARSFNLVEIFLLDDPTVVANRLIWLYDTYGYRFAKYAPSFYAGLVADFGTSFTGSITTNVLTITVIDPNFPVHVNDYLTGSGVTDGTQITGQLTGTTGLAGTYSVTSTPNVGSQTIYSSAYSWMQQDLTNPTKMAAWKAAYMARAISLAPPTITNLKNLKRVIFQTLKAAGWATSDCPVITGYEGGDHNSIANVLTPFQAGINQALIEIKQSTAWYNHILTFAGDLFNKVGLAEQPWFIDYDQPGVNVPPTYIATFGVTPGLQNPASPTQYKQALLDAYAAAAASVGM